MRGKQIAPGHLHQTDRHRQQPEQADDQPLEAVPQLSGPVIGVSSPAVAPHGDLSRDAGEGNGPCDTSPLPLAGEVGDPGLDPGEPGEGAGGNHAAAPIASCTSLTISGDSLASRISDC